jgi:hypothetical protein
MSHIPTFLRTPLLIAAIGCAPSTWAQVPEALSAAIKQFTSSQGMTTAPAYRFALADLNGDSNPDAVVLLTGSDWCGSGGCTLVVFAGLSDGFRLISDTSVTLEPIRRTLDRSHGWSNLIVHSRGRGEVVLKFNGKKYPSNPSTQPLAGKQSLASSVTLFE